MRTGIKWINSERKPYDRTRTTTKKRIYALVTTTWERFSCLYKFHSPTNFMPKTLSSFQHDNTSDSSYISIFSCCTDSCFFFHHALPNFNVFHCRFNEILLKRKINKNYSFMNSNTEKLPRKIVTQFFSFLQLIPWKSKQKLNEQIFVIKFKNKHLKILVFISH